MKCEFCERKVSNKGFRGFIKRPCISIFPKKGTPLAYYMVGEATFQIRICNSCLKKKGQNLGIK